MYGIDESMRVLDDLYGVETQYYARVNFYGLTKIVDALGGVDVYSEQTFTTKVMQIPDKNGNLYDDYFSFTEGMNYNVDGQAALAFCRERYSFSDGDNQRGRNQMAMIKAIFNKATSSAILTKYDEVLKAVADTMITNMPYEDISSLVKMRAVGYVRLEHHQLLRHRLRRHGGVLLHARSGPVGHVARL